MSILTPEAPPGVTAAFLKGLSSIMGARDARRKEGYVGEQTRVPTRDDVGDTRDRAIVHLWQKVYWMGLGHAAENAGVAAITRTGWRCFAGRTRETVVMGTVMLRGRDQWRMSSLNYGEWPWACLKATEQLYELPEVRDADYELRVLAIAALSTEAFWLVAQKEGQKDIIVPFHGPSAEDRLPTEEIRTLPNYLAWIRPQAMAALHGR